MKRNVSIRMLPTDIHFQYKSKFQILSQLILKKNN